MNFMPLTRKGGCKVTIFLRDNTHIGKQIASMLMIINQNRVKKATINIKISYELFADQQMGESIRKK